MMQTSFSVTSLIILSIIYLLLLFSIAWLSEHNKLPPKLINNPVIYVLSLGIYNSAWTFYGVIGFAHQYGCGYLAIILGFSAAFLLLPVLLYPLLKTIQTYQLSSLADLFAFRFCSRWAGLLTALFMLIALLPLLSLQIRAVTHSVSILSQQPPSQWVSFIFCLVLIVFALLFGSSQVSIREKRTGLIVAIAFESAVKLFALLTITLYVIYGVFGGIGEVNNWFAQNKDFLQTLHARLDDGSWRTLLTAFFASAVVMPHIFHMIFTENVTSKTLKIASWGLPIYLWVVALCIPILLWGGLEQGLTIDTDYYILGIGAKANSSTLMLLAYIGGVSGASGVIIVSSIALSGMILNHFILSFYSLPSGVNIYRWLKWIRRFLITAIILLGYLFYLLVNKQYSNSEVMITAFIATLQFFPGVLALLYWKGGNKKGFIAGILTGFTCWILIMLVPLVMGSTSMTLPLINKTIILDPANWHLASTILFSLNTIIFIIVSLVTKMPTEEKYAAELCAVDAKQPTQQRKVRLNSPKEFIEALSIPLGTEVAQNEVARALSDLDLSTQEHRPYALRRLRECIEANLSGLIGPHSAKQIVNSYLPYLIENTKSNEDIYFIESRLENYKSRLTGLAAELDGLRRYHRFTLQALPIGVCSLSKNQEVLLWNNAMEIITSVNAEAIFGVNIEMVGEPWSEILKTFIAHSEEHLYKQRIDINDHAHWYNLRKAAIGESVLINSGGLVILIEDITETYLLEDRLIHSERLASIGRLAAGVAHEIGNPVTGIACLAQILREERPEDHDVVEMSEQIIEQTKRISRIVQSLVNFAHAGGEVQKDKPVSWFEVTQETIQLLELNKDKKQVIFKNQCDPKLKVSANAQRLAQVLINLLDNARDASQEGQEIIIYTVEHPTTIELLIEDHGEGISEEIQDWIFEPFFTTKEPGAGTGLGLPLVYSIVEDHHGKITVKSPIDLITNSGTSFSIILPKYVELLLLEE